MSLWVDGLSLLFFREQEMGLPEAVKGASVGRGKGREVEVLGRETVLLEV